MNNIIRLLKNLKKNGVTGIKQSLEDEGASFEEIKKMRQLTKKAGLDLNVKIGGCEARNDIFFCKKVGTDGIVAPMVESSYALNKFTQIAGYNRDNFLFVNLESKLALKNLKEIMNSKNFNLLKGVIIGRSDLAGSMGLTKKMVDSNRIFKNVLLTFRKLKKKKKSLVCKMGGSITYNSKEFIEDLYKKNILDRVETRNVEILLNKKNIKKFKHLLILAFRFEVEWLKAKLKMRVTKNKIVKKEYLFRIQQIQKRIKTVN